MIPSPTLQSLMGNTSYQEIPSTRVTIIVPTYNRQCISECLNSLRLLDVDKNVASIIVVARDPNLWLRNEIKRYVNSRIPVRLIEYNLPGNGPAKNHAVQFANSEFIAFTDDDCIVHSDWLQQLLDCQVLKMADIVVGDCPSYNIDNKYLNAHQAHIQCFQRTLSEVGLYPLTSCGTTMNMLIRKSTFEAIGGFDDAFAVHYGDDRDFNARWVQHARAVFNRFAIVWHNHPLTLKSFLRLSFRYGIGIKKCADLARARGDKEIPSYPSRSDYIGLKNFTKTEYGSIEAKLVILSQEVKRLGYSYAERNPNAISKNV